MRTAHTEFETLVGLTVEQVVEIDSYHVLTFTDGTYAALSGRLEFGIWTQAEFDGYYEAARERDERATYERLKAKFGE